MPQPETKHFTTKATVTPDGDGQGLLEAVFSTFDTVDSQGDVVLKSTFTEGQEVPMVWSHDWGRPIGKGTVHVTAKQAVFKGQLWLDTDDGLQAFRKIRNSGSLQEFSWGFQITDAEPGVKDGQAVRFIKAAEVYEVSPVLVGANRHTHVLSLKAAEAAGVVGVAVEVEEPAEPVSEPGVQEKSAAGSFDWTRQRVYAALVQDINRYCYIVDLFADHVVYSSELDGPGAPDQLYRRDYSVSAAGEVTLGDVVAVDVQYVDMPSKALRPQADVLGSDLLLLARHVSGSADLADDETRKALQSTIARLEQAQRELSAALKRTDPIAQVEPRNQYRRFQELTALHGLSSAP